MGTVFDDFNNMLFRDFQNLGYVKLKKWWEDLSFIVSKESLETFEIQFRSKGAREWAVTYHVISDGSIHTDNPSGGIDYYKIPSDASVGIVVTYTPNEEVS
ncbi:MAG: hypothetical protein AAFV78_08185, partial [Bacteroidota bacterium]